jgi:hypothetical protein
VCALDLAPRLRHVVERLAQRERPLLDRLLELGSLVTQAVLCALELQQPASPQVERVAVDGLVDEVVDAHLERPPVLVRACEPRDHDDGQERVLGHLADALGDLEAVHVGHLSVEQDQVHAERQLRQGLDAVGRFFGLVS